MTNAIALDSRQIALELYELLRDLDPSHWSDELGVGARERLNRLETRVKELLNLYWPDDTLELLNTRMHEVSRLIRDFAPTIEMPGWEEKKDEWIAFRRRMQPAYESLAASLRAEDIHVPSLRPTNYARNVFHALSAVSALIVMHFVLTPMGVLYVTAALAATAWTCEASRRMSRQWNSILMALFRPLAHPHEVHRVNSGTWYLTALFALALTGRPVLWALALVVLGFADPAAALIGRRYGTIRLVHGRSLEGTSAFIGVALIGSIFIMRAWHPEIGWGATLALAAAGAVTGALAELFSLRMDDNLSVPLAVAAGAGLMGILIGHMG